MGLEWYEDTHTYGLPPLPQNIHKLKTKKHAHDELRARIKHEEAQPQQHRGPDEEQLWHLKRVLRFLLNCVGVFAVCMWARGFNGG